ncbi:uncharacterized protein HMPREF1541_06868 [Cyphellophora europaea CBS 101466]|uniref:Uncharacterized protein n=1 Tax=Cyphellophora europaea (strain CBS 101466) TaxID=1220924 RepID=W2RSY0_CYPE1|nr:uncharacterized protein HMPREF1541_06868 [Cyphellophora europaea CBS 101466]ETN38829.1 hypothetical protein HMPREF1541_06868 [Cyphellophora europaea CBS 101466]
MLVPQNSFLLRYLLDPLLSPRPKLRDHRNTQQIVPPHTRKASGRVQYPARPHLILPRGRMKISTRASTNVQFAVTKFSGAPKSGPATSAGLCSTLAA